MEITKIENTFKLGQNRNKEDQYGMLTGLQNSDSGIELAEFIQLSQENFYEKN